MQKPLLTAAVALAAMLPAGFAMAQNCSGAPLYFHGEIAEVEGAMTVKAGKGCSFNLDGIPGAINEASISQKPKVGRAGIEGLKPYYIAKPGYQGPDEFAYTFVGTGRYGGSMRITIKRKITVVP